jgi:hypothetical protein
LKKGGVATIVSTGASSSATGADEKATETATPTGSAVPVENTGAASRVGAALFAVAGAAAVYVL